ncbi:MAG: bleomycin resistance protein [Chloroflexota bacterium]|nr:MAG: bleomycin resistance family protein [Chloroflexota bacterium]
MRMIQAIPALPVREITTAVDFYRDKLGFDSFYHEGGFARLRRSDVEIQLWEASDEDWKTRPAETPFRAVVSGAESFLAGTASCRIAVQGIDDLYAEYKEKGALYDSETKIVTEWWGDRDFHALDQDRNLITFFERPDS